MKNFILTFLLLSSQFILAKTPEEYSLHYHTELQKIHVDDKLSLANSKLALLKKMKGHLASEQKLGKLKTVLSLKKFVTKLVQGDFSMGGLDLLDSPKGQKIFSSYEKEVEDNEKLTILKQEKLLLFFKKAMQRKVVQLTKAGQLEEAIKFQNLADEGPGKVIVAKVAPVKKIKPEMVPLASQNGIRKDGFYEASAWNERTPAFVAIEDGKAYLIRIKPSNKQLSMYQIEKWPFIENPLNLAANGRSNSFTYAFFDKSVTVPSDVAEFFHKYKGASKFPLIKLTGELPTIRKMTDEELKSLPKKFRIREIN